MDFVQIEKRMKALSREIGVNIECTKLGITTSRIIAKIGHITFVSITWLFESNFMMDWYGTDIQQNVNMDELEMYIAKAYYKALLMQIESVKDYIEG